MKCSFDKNGKFLSHFLKPEYLDSEPPIFLSRMKFFYMFKSIPDIYYRHKVLLLGNSIQVDFLCVDKACLGTYA